MRSQCTELCQNVEGTVYRIVDARELIPKYDMVVRTLAAARERESGSFGDERFYNVGIVAHNIMKVGAEAIRLVQGGVRPTQFFTSVEEALEHVRKLIAGENPG